MHGMGAVFGSPQALVLFYAMQLSLLQAPDQEGSWLLFVDPDHRRNTLSVSNFRNSELGSQQSVCCSKKVSVVMPFALGEFS